MSLFSSESLTKLREQVDLVELLSAHLELKRAGGLYRALCPFHEERTPSFVVRQGDSHYHCFGCGAHGDAIAFMMEHLHLSFPESVETLAAKFGVVVQREETATKGGGETGKQKLRPVVQQAGAIYHELLLHAECAREALTYLYGRGIDLEFIRQFKLGYAPDGRFLQAVMETMGLPGTLLKEAGLLTERGTDFFSDRILFPITDGVGRVVGFSGRRYKEGGHGGKYINTPETPLFHKSHILFGLHESRRRIAKERRAFLVEGQIDCLRLINYGFNLTVAPLGTAFTENHVQQLKSLGVLEVVIAFDSDKAGREAASKAGHLLQKEGIGVRVANLPEGLDPDSLLLEQGPEAFLSAVQEARDYLAFLVSHLTERMGKGGSSQTSELMREIKSRIEQWQDPVVVHESLRHLARLLNLPEEMVGVAQVVPSSFTVVQQARIEPTGLDTAEVLESDVLRWLLLMNEETAVFELAHASLRPENFRSEASRKIFEALMGLWHGGASRDLMSVAIALGEGEALQAFSRLLERRINRQRVKELFPQAVQRLLERDWMSERDTIRRRIQSGNLSDNEAIELTKEFNQIIQQRPTVKWP